MRCMSLCLAAHQQLLRPENDYLEISQHGIAKKLPALLEIDRELQRGLFKTRTKNSLGASGTTCCAPSQ
jgi:hypothetical protein